MIPRAVTCLPIFLMFFVFADTVATRREAGRGWLGIRFQAESGADPSEIIIHVRMLDKESIRQQEALGVIGVNLVHGAFYLHREPEALIRNALALDPDHPKALWLEASVLHETGRYAQAVASWQHLAAVLGPQSGDAQLIAANIAEDQRLAGQAPAPGGKAAAAGTVAVVEGEVVLDPKLAGKVPAGLTLFIVARSVASPGPPVAILKLTTGSWPVRFRLDDSLSMVPGRNLSSAGQVTIEARTSRTGQAAPQPGDFQGDIGPLVPAGSKPQRLVMGKVVG